MGIEKNIEEMIKRSGDCYSASKGKECFTCKHGRCKSDGKGGFTVYCKHPQNTHETNYKYAAECWERNEYKYWEPDCDMKEIKIGHIEKFAEALKELQEMAENI